MKVERLISTWDKNTEELVNELNVDHIELQVLKTIFNPEVDDPLMYNPYMINVEHAEQLTKVISIEFDFEYFEYSIDCYQV